MGNRTGSAGPWRDGEQSDMDKRLVKGEGHSALFVPDNGVQLPTYQEIWRIRNILHHISSKSTLGRTTFIPNSYFETGLKKGQIIHIFWECL